MITSAILAFPATIGTRSVRRQGLPERLMATSRLLEAAASKLKAEKKEENKVIKSEPNPSPTKKLASEFEKKIKTINGDTTLIKDDGNHQ